MLTKVVLTRFRGFESLEAELRPISVILGPNSSGKTSLLHAVRVAVEAISIGLEQGHPELTKDGWITVYVAAQAGDGGGAGGARLGTVRLSSTPYPRQAASRNTASILPIRRDVQVLLTCLPQLLGPARRLFQWFSWTKRWSKRRSEDMEAGEGRFAEEIAEPVELVVEPLPCWKGLGEEERRRAVRGLVEAVESEARARDTPVMGARAVRAQHPHTRPEHLKRSPRPLGHASTRQALRELREQYRTFVAAFREAAARWRRGDFSAPFPLYSFPPRVVPSPLTRIL